MRLVLLPLLILVLVLPALAAVNVPVQNLRLAATAGFEAAPAAGMVKFKKTSDERRLLAFVGTPASDPSGAKALEVAYRVDLGKGNAPRLAVLAYEKDGGCWYKLSSNPIAIGAEAQARLSVAAPMQTAFSSDASGQLEWPNVDRVWVGFIFDGPAEGKTTVTSARFTDEAAVPTKPISLLPENGGKWGDGHDPAIQTKLEVVPEGPGGAAALKYEFNVPAGKHMYAIPSTPVALEDAEGYKFLRFKFKGEIPQGMRLLIQLTEHGGATYYVELPAQSVADWTEISLPLSDFKLASWGQKDDNGMLDLGRLSTISIGSHGVPVNARLGLIMATDVQLAP
ncbi:MAG: hypothetical protein ABFD96_24065 [Armatimonadia bacterium]